MSDEPASVRARLAQPARQVVAGATDRRFDAVEADLARILARLGELEELAQATSSEVLALRQQADETLDYLRVQHAIVRDVLEVLRPVMPPGSDPA